MDNIGPTCSFFFEMISTVSGDIPLSFCSLLSPASSHFFAAYSEDGSDGSVSLLVV